MGWTQFDMWEYPRPSVICRTMLDEYGIGVHGIQTTYDGKDCFIHFLKCRMSGYTNFFGVVEINFFDDTPSIRYIASALIHAVPTKNGCSFAYKMMDETVGPYTTGCPNEYMDMCTEPLNEFAAGFREREREKNKEKSILISQKRMRKKEIYKIVKENMERRK